MIPLEVFTDVTLAIEDADDHDEDEDSEDYLVMKDERDFEIAKEIKMLK